MLSLCEHSNHIPSACPENNQMNATESATEVVASMLADVINTGERKKLTAEDIYASVNARIDAALERGTVPWLQPWIGGDNYARNLQSGKAYRGINALLLSSFINPDFTDPRWTTFAAAKKMGGSVRKGEKSSLVTLWKRIRIKDPDADGGSRTIGLLRYFRVFNVEQVRWPEGVLSPFEREARPDGWDADAAAESTLDAFLASANAPTIGYGGSSAHYSPGTHSLQLPLRGAFRSAAGFYGTAFHECAHSTGHKSMLDRSLTCKVGDSYAREELVAEFTSTMVCASVGVDGAFENSAAYINSWRQRISADPKLLVTAAGKAQKASDRILGIENTYTEAAL